VALQIADPPFIVELGPGSGDKLLRLAEAFSTGPHEAHLHLIEGVEVFRRLYTAVGLGVLAAPTRLPGMAQLLDLGYRWFAKERLRLTGRCADGACELSAGPKQT